LKPYATLLNFPSECQADRYRPSRHFAVARKGGRK
jgi:hypothetical protein